MLSYWLAFAILTLGATLQGSTPSTPRVPRPLFIAVGLLLVAMIGLRYDVGPDWTAYSYIFYGTKFWTALRSAQNSDPAFYLLIWAIHQGGGEIWVLNLICAAIFVFGLFSFARRQPSPWLAVLVAFPYLGVVVAMSGTRQSAAIGFLFLALNAYRDKSLIKFMIFISIAALFHASAILMAPICLFSSTKNKLQTLALVIITILLGRYVLLHSFDVYATRYSSTNVQSSGAIYRIAMNAISSILFLRFSKSFGLEAGEVRLWRIFSLLALAAVPLLFIIPSSTALDRFILYLFPLQSLVFSFLPWVLSKSIRDLRAVVALVVAYSALVLLVYLNFSEYGRYYIPYKMFFVNGETSYVPVY